ncbi:MAG: PstS family phosphate ABC transporter substrate-binding protein [Cytophagales bacterium]|nr:MAG: PstS family phosphate ABC transporter substrate-binding protein [Cytophagales bacterium]
MFKSISLFISILLCSSCSRPENNITMSGAFGLYPLAIKWAEEYKKIHPEVSFDISAGGAGKGMADMLSENVDFAMLSRDISKRELEKGSFPVAVCIDAVIPTCNTQNPEYKNILKQGLSREDFINIFITDKVRFWGDVISSDLKTSCNVYTRSDAAGAPETWAKFLGKKQEDLLGIGVFGDPGLAEAIKNDPQSIGFNNVVFIYNPETGKPHKNLSAIPIDINNNGTIDPDENFYSNLSELVEAIGQGKYPKPPARLLYLVSKGKMKNKLQLDFIQWVLNDGQKFLKENGYIQLTEEQLNQERTKIQ